MHYLKLQNNILKEIYSPVNNSHEDNTNERKTYTNHPGKISMQFLHSDFEIEIATLCDMSELEASKYDVILTPKSKFFVFPFR